MNIYILNYLYMQVGLIDGYKSLIWTKRYNALGDCEICIPASTTNRAMLKLGNYIMRTDDDMVCRIEYIELDTDEENGDFLIVKGYDCKKILNQRIIYYQVNFSGTVEDYIRKLIDGNIINAYDRSIEKFQLGTRQGYTETIEDQVQLENLGDKVQELCQTYGYGSKVTLDIDQGTFTFDLYKGSERSVVFSSEFDNLISSKYVMDKTNYHNSAIIGGEGEGSSRKRQQYGVYEGLKRYEMYVDAKETSSNGGVIPYYSELMESRAKEELAKYDIVTTFEGEIEPNYSYKYNVDYYLGDIVTIKNKYDIEINARITEVIESWDDTGYSIIPTLQYKE